MSESIPAYGPTPDRPIRSRIQLLKAKVKDERLTATFTEQPGVEAPADTHTVTCGSLVHPDLSRAFSHLVPHLCLLTDQLPTTLLPDDGDKLDDVQEACIAPFAVTGITYGGSGERAGFTLIGTRELANGHQLNLTAPFLTNDEASTHLTSLLRALDTEVEAALRGKCAPNPQLDLFAPEAGGADNHDDEPADDLPAPRRRGRLRQQPA